MGVSTVDLRSVWSILPNQESVTLKPKGPVASDITVPGAVRRPVTDGPISSGQFGEERENRIYLLPAAGLSGNTPQPHWHIVDVDSKTWTISSVKGHLHDTGFYCECNESGSA